MKKKVLVIFLFIVFALPIPVAALGFLLTLLWFVTSLLSDAHVAESIYALVGMLIGATYLGTYLFAVIMTCKQKKMSFKTFTPLLHCAVAGVYLIAMNPIGNYISQTTEYFGFAKKDYTVIEELDTHGGFQGDGSYYLILDCSDNRDKALEIAREWKPLPLSENLNLVMYGGEKDGVTYGYELAEEAHIPKVENGYYIFEDRSSESKDSTDDSELFDRHSFNFSIAIYDCETDRMYYFEYDT